MYETMQEWQLYENWEYFALSAEMLHYDGHSLQIFEAGERNEQYGPDYRNAFFELDGVCYRGSVELHVNSKEWFSHGHHLDDAYSDVILHVVSAQAENPLDVWHTRWQKSIPTFALPVPKNVAGNHGLSRICRGKIKNSAEMRRILHNLALERFYLKEQAFIQALHNYSFDKLFYDAFLRALGYPSNSNRFELLAWRTGLENLHKYFTYDEYLAYYFGLAGFLDVFFKEDYAHYLKSIFNNFKPILCEKPLQGWQLAGLRNANHPQFRLAAWAACLVKYRFDGLISSLHDLFYERGEYVTFFRAYYGLFNLTPNDYWQQHYALDKPLKKKKNKQFLGIERQNEILTNVLLPLFSAEARQSNNWGLVAYIQDVYLHVPGHAVYGRINRYFPWWQEYADLWTAYNLAQAFLHLEKFSCHRAACACCPLQRQQPEILQLTQKIKIANM